MIDTSDQTSQRRLKLFYLSILVIFFVFAGRLFQVQVLNGEHYSSLALLSQERKYEISAQRGNIYGLNRDKQQALVLNENLPTIFADPRYIDDKLETAEKVAEILGGKSEEYLEQFNLDTSYVVLKKKVPTTVARQIGEAKIKGVGYLDEYYRAYPENGSASHILGFVNAEGLGQYGIEEHQNETLSGANGRVEAITDVNGTVLRNEERNVLQAPVDGNDLVLNIDVNLQKWVEDRLRIKVREGNARGGGAIVMDSKTGAIKAMASYPTFHPSNYTSVKDFSVFINSVVSSPYEVGSVAKLLTMATGLNEGVVSRNSTYFNSGSVRVGDRTIENVGVPAGSNRTMEEVIQLSINTGVVHVLKQLGDGEINAKARRVLHDYFTKKFGLGALTNIEQAGEAPGIIHPPEQGDGLNIRYANMTFGQGMTANVLQIASAVSAIVNGGTYYQPQLIHSIALPEEPPKIHQPIVVRDNVISQKASRDLKAMMEKVIEGGGGTSALKAGYMIGGKTGTSQVVLSDGTYSDTREIGSFVGFVEGGDGSQYVVMTRIDEPKGYLYAGSGSAAPLFAEIVHWLIDYYRISPVR